MKLPVSVLIMAQNEEQNIGHALASVAGRFDQVVVADAFSTDRTAELCRSFPGVELYTHAFDGWAEQRNWMLAECRLRNDVVFFLDADEYVDEPFVRELAAILDSGVSFAAIYLQVAFVFLNRRLKYAYGHPAIKRIFARRGLSFSGAGAREYARAAGPTLAMRSPLHHHDRRPLSVWIDKHNRNADREAAAFLQAAAGRAADPAPAGISPALRAKLWVRTRIWNRLPLLFRPFLYFVYRYVCRLGFLDGRAGFVFCFLHALWYQSLIDIKILEQRGAACRTEK